MSIIAVANPVNITNKLLSTNLDAHPSIHTISIRLDNLQSVVEKNDDQMAAELASLKKTVGELQNAIGKLDRRTKNMQSEVGSTEFRPTDLVKSKECGIDTQAKDVQHDLKHTHLELERTVQDNQLGLEKLSRDFGIDLQNIHAVMNNFAQSIRYGMEKHSQQIETMQLEKIKAAQDTQLFINDIRSEMDKLVENTKNEMNKTWAGIEKVAHDKQLRINKLAQETKLDYHVLGKKISENHSLIYKLGMKFDRSISQLAVSTQRDVQDLSNSILKEVSKTALKSQQTYVSVEKLADDIDSAIETLVEAVQTNKLETLKLTECTQKHQFDIGNLIKNSERAFIHLNKLVQVVHQVQLGMEKTSSGLGLVSRSAIESQLGLTKLGEITHLGLEDLGRHTQLAMDMGLCGLRDEFTNFNEGMQKSLIETCQAMIQEATNRTEKGFFDKEKDDALSQTTSPLREEYPGTGIGRAAHDGKVFREDLSQSMNEGDSTVGIVQAGRGGGGGGGWCAIM
jgi:hypothetical protein